jgi:hypothetical protein
MGLFELAERPESIGETATRRRRDRNPTPQLLAWEKELTGIYLSEASARRGVLDRASGRGITNVVALAERPKGDVVRPASA